MIPPPAAFARGTKVLSRYLNVYSPIAGMLLRSGRPGARSGVRPGINLDLRAPSRRPQVAGVIDRIRGELADLRRPSEGPRVRDLAVQGGRRRGLRAGEGHLGARGPGAASGG